MDRIRADERASSAPTFRDKTEPPGPRDGRGPGGQDKRSSVENELRHSP